MSGGGGGTTVPLIGREGLLADALRALADPTVRVVTLFGRQGTGKTRLALAVAEALHGPWHLVRLDDAAGEAEYLARGLQGLGLAESGTTSQAALLLHLAEHGCTLVLDGCSDVDAAYEQARTLLQHAPTVRLLVTAPVPLELPDEHSIAVPPLALPVVDSTDPDVLRRSPAVQLFQEAAALGSPHVQIGEADLGTVAEVCRRLDGLPAALVVAAARLSLMQPSVLLEHMARLGAWELVGMSLEEEVARTFDLLDDDTRATAVALAVTEGGASITAVTAISGGRDEGQVMSALALLTDLELAESDAAHGRVALRSGTADLVRRRYRGTQEWADCTARHTEHHVADARRFARRPHGARMDPGWLLDHRNRLGALAALRSAGDRQGALRLAVDAMPGFEHRGEPVAGRALLAEVLHQTPETTSGACIEAHVWLGRLEAERGDGLGTASAWGHFARALHLARERGHLVPHLEVLNAVCENQVLLEDGVQHCEDAVEEALGLTAAEGLELVRSIFLCWHAANLHRRLRCPEAGEAIAEALTTARAHGDLRLLMSFAIVHWQLPPDVRAEGGVPSLQDLLDMADAQGDVRVKGWIWIVAVHTAIEDGSDRVAVEHALGMADLARRTRQRPLARQVLAATVRLLDRHPDPELAVLLAGALARHAEHLVTHLPPRFVTDLRAAVARAQADLGADAAAHAHAEGARLGVWTALDRCEAQLHRLRSELEPAGLAAVRPSVVDGLLTPRETDVLAALCGGASNKEVARALGLRPKTVAHHCAAIYAKLEVRNRTEAVSEALRRGLPLSPAT